MAYTVPTIAVCEPFETFANVVEVQIIVTVENLESVSESVAELTSEQIVSIEQKFCRPNMRLRFWDRTHIRDGAIGRFLKQLLDERNTLAPASRVSAKQLREQVDGLEGQGLRPLGHASWNKFMNGKPTGTGWVKVAKRALRLIIANVPECELASPEIRQPLARIEKFFFPKVSPTLQTADGTVSRWYFSERLKSYTIPMTSHEVFAELRSLAYDAERDIPCRIVRVSGAAAFPQTVDADGLEATGELTLYCLKAGVRVTYIVRPETNASQSARKFEEYCKAEDAMASRNLEVLELGDEEKGGRIASDYLSPIFRWTCYQRPRRDGQITSLIPTRTMVRNPELLAAFQPCDSELEDFLAWVEAVS